MPKVSIIMGIYNCASTLNEAIDSILNQTFLDWQLIMCDDGSTDDTYKVAALYADRYPKKIILIKNETNLGLNYTLNRCLELAEGEYIARMDGDDISLENRLEIERFFLDNNPQYAIVSTPMILFDEGGDWGKTTAIEYPSKNDFIRHNPVHCHAPCMIRKEAYLAVGGYTIDKRMLRFEDVNLWFKLYSKGYSGCNLTDPLYKMRDDRNAATRRSLRSRIKAVYVLYVGYRMFHYKWYVYLYLPIDLAKHIIKTLLPRKTYMILHKRKRKMVD